MPARVAGSGDRGLMAWLIRPPGLPSPDGRMKLAFWCRYGKWRRFRLNRPIRKNSHRTSPRKSID